MNQLEVSNVEPSKYIHYQFLRYYDSKEIAQKVLDFQTSIYNRLKETFTIYSRAEGSLKEHYEFGSDNTPLWRVHIRYSYTLPELIDGYPGEIKIAKTYDNETLIGFGNVTVSD